MGWVDSKKNKGAFTKKKNWNPSDVEIQFFENISWSDAFDDFFFFLYLIWDLLIQIETI